MNKKLLTLASIVTTAVALTTGSWASATVAYKSSILESGLVSPRGITLGPDGNLYLTEAGNGGGSNGSNCIVAGSGNTVCYGATGAIGEYNLSNNLYRQLITDLPSLATKTGTDGTGIHDLYFDNGGNLYGILGFGADPSLRSNLGISSFGKLISVNLSGTPSWSVGPDISAYEAANNPDGLEINSNPYSLAIGNGITYVADAGGNDILQVSNTETISLTHLFPTQSVNLPFPPFAPYPMQAVPTGIVIGPDNNLYIAQFTGFPFPPGGASIYRLNSGGVTQFATGFTNLIGLAFGPNGNLFALQYATNYLGGNFQGSVWEITPDGTKTNIFSEGLVSPTGIAVSSDGTIYVANRGAVAGEGELLALTPVPEPSNQGGIILLGVGLIPLIKRKVQDLTLKLPKSDDD